MQVVTLTWFRRAVPCHWFRDSGSHHQKQGMVHADHQYHSIPGVAGYVARVLVLHKPRIGLYAMMQALLIISPVLLSIVNYIVAGRILRYVDVSQFTSITARPMG